MRTALALLVVLGSAIPVAAQSRESIFAPLPGTRGLSGQDFGTRSLKPSTPRLTTGPLTDSLRKQPLDRKIDPLGPDGEIQPPMPSEPYALPSQKPRENR